MAPVAVAAGDGLWSTQTDREVVQVVASRRQQVVETAAGTDRRAGLLDWWREPWVHAPGWGVVVLPVPLLALALQKQMGGPQGVSYG